MKVNTVSSIGYVPYKDIIDIRFGKVTIYKNPQNNDYYIRKGQIFQSEKDLKQKILQIERRLEEPNLYYVPPKCYEVVSANQFCSNLSRLLVYHPFPEVDFRKELDHRIQKNDYFSQRELMTLLYDTLHGMYHLQKLGYCHGKFGPEWVAKTLSGYAIIDDPLNNNDLPQNLNEKKHVYLSPEARNAAIKHLPPSSTYNIPKADVFAIGLFVLEAALLRRLNDYLDPVSSRPKILGDAID